MEQKAVRDHWNLFFKTNAKKTHNAIGFRVFCTLTQLQPTGNKAAGWEVN